MTGFNPDDIADKGAEVDAYWAAIQSEERKRISAMMRLRNAIRARAGDDLVMFPFSDGGNGDRFSSRNVGRILLDGTKKTERIFYYLDDDTKRWVKDTIGQQTRWCREIIASMRDKHEQLELQQDPLAQPFAALIKASDKISGYNAMATIGCESHGMMVNPMEHFDVRADIIAANDTMLELRKNGVHPRDITAEDMVTMTTGVPYEPQILARPPKPILEYHQTFMPDGERARLFYKILGSSLLGGNKNRLFVIMKGKSTTGKSQIMEAMEAALGDYVGTGSPSVFRGNLDDKARPDIIALLKKRIALFNEASDAWELHGDRVKDLTGGGKTAVRNLYQGDIITVRPQFTPVILTNEMPRIVGVDSGTKRRLLVIAFEHSLPAGTVEDPDIKQRFIEDENVQKWLLARLVQGYVEATREGIDDALIAFSLDTLNAFVELTNTGAFLSWLEDTGQLRKLSEDEQKAGRIKSTYPPLDMMYDRYKYWALNRGGRRDKFDYLDYGDFNKDLKANHGWTTVKSGVHRWEGVQLSMMPPTGILNDLIPGSGPDEVQ